MNDLTLCDDIINHFKNLSPNKKGEGMVGFNNIHIDRTKKDSIEGELEWDETVGSVSYRYVQELRKCTDQYIEKYPEANYYNKWGITEKVKIQYYVPGGGYPAWHTERAERNNNRHLVFMTYLNDVEDGGETEFKLQNLKIKAEKGKTVIWPVDWTYTHRGIISPKQEKYIVTGWYDFID